MRSTFAAAALILSMATIATAQDLNTVSITDQFDLGDRGANGTGTATDGTNAVVYSGADSTGNPNYINTYAGATETPVLSVTGQMGNVDRGLNTLTIPANNRPGATDGTLVVVVGDDGGQNTLSFGETDDTNYYAEVDIYCWDRSTFTPGVELGYLAVRAAQDQATDPDSTLTGGAINIDRELSYYLAVDYRALTVTAYASSDNSAYDGRTTLAGPLAVTEGWHTLRIEADGTNIGFHVDGTLLGQVTDSTVTSGRAALGHRETGVTAADEIQSVFDNLKAGPFSSVAEWSMY